MAKNITLMGASYSAVPSVILPQTGGGNAQFYDVSDTTAAASDVASGKLFYTALGVLTTGTASGGGASPWHKLITAREDAVSTTSTSAASAFTVALGSSAFTKDQIIWVHIRDKAGAKAGYFFGSDAFFINYNKASASTSTFSVPAVICLRYNNSAYSGTAGQYGVYGYSINSSGTLTVRKRYNSSYSLTVNGTYVTNVYALDLPDSLKLFT